MNNMKAQSSLYSEFERRTEALEWNDRKNLLEKIFFSSKFPLQDKELIILNYLFHKITGNEDYRTKDVYAFVSYLVRSIRGQSVLKIKLHLFRVTVTEVLKLILFDDDASKHYLAFQIACGFFSANSLELWFSDEVVGLKFMVQHIYCLLSTEEVQLDDINLVSNTIKTFIKWKKKTRFSVYHNNNLAKKCLLSVIKLLYELSLSDVGNAQLFRSILSTEIESLLDVLLFNENLRKYYEALVNQLFENDSTSIPEEVEGLFVAIINVMGNTNFQVALLMYSVLFNGLSKKYRESKVLNVYSSLALCCHLTRVNPTYKEKSLISSGKFPRVPKFNSNQILVILKALLEVLCVENHDLSITIKEVSFLNWLQSLVNYLVVSKHERPAAWCDILESLAKVNPSILETSLGVIIQAVIFGEIEGPKANSTQFILFLIDTFCAIRQMPKFISKLLQSIGYAANRPQLKFNFPNEIFHKFGDIKELIPAPQVSQLWHTLIKSCSEEMFPGNCDDYLLLKHSEVALRFFSVLLDHYKTSDVYKGFNLNVNAEDLIRDTDRLVQKFMEFILKNEFDEDFVFSFLTLLHSWREYLIISFLYGLECSCFHNKNVKNPIACHWSFYSKNLEELRIKIISSSQGPCIKQLVKLQLQKYKFIKLMENTENCCELFEDTLPLINSLVENFNVASFEFRDLLPFLMKDLSALQIEHVTRHIVCSLCEGGSPWKNILMSDAYQQSVSLQIGFAWNTCCLMMNCFSRVKKKSRESFMQSTLNLFNSEIVNKFELIYQNRKMLRNDESHDFITFVSKIAGTLWKGVTNAKKNSISGSLCIEEISNLLEYLSSLCSTLLLPSCQIFIAFTIVALLSHLEEVENSPKTILKPMLYKVIFNIFSQPDSFQFFNYFKSGDFMVWLLSSNLEKISIGDKSSFYDMYGALCQKIVRGAEVLADSQSFVTYLCDNTLDNLPMITSLILSLNGIKSPKSLELGKKYKKELTKSLSRAISNEDAISKAEDYLFICKYLCELKLPKMEKHGIKRWNKYFEKPMHYSFHLLENSYDANNPATCASMDFLRFICDNRKTTMKYCDPIFSQQLWNIIKVNSIDWYIFEILECCQVETFSQILGEMQALTVENGFKHPWLIKYWNCLASMKLKRWKEKLRGFAFNIFFSKCINLTDEEHSNILELLVVCLTLLSNNTVIFSGDFMTGIFYIVANTNLNLSNTTEVFHSIYKVLNAMFMYQSAALFNLIPIFMQSIKKLLNDLCNCCNQELHIQPDRISEYEECALLIERIISLLPDQRIQFSKIVSYLISDIIHHFHRFKLYPAVKKPLEQCIYILLSICDEHAISNMRVALPDDSKELFRHFYDTFERYYRYKGKI